jgi:protein YIPF1/2
MLLIVVVALHAGYAIAIRILCFAHGSPARKVEDKLPADDGDAARMLFGF